MQDNQGINTDTNAESDSADTQDAGLDADATGSVIYPTRLERIEYDFDNNGIIDGIETWSYDDSRLSAMAFEYIGDGTQDLLSGLPFIGAMASETLFSYDEAGRLIEVNLALTQNTAPEAAIQGAGSATDTTTYEYDGDSEVPSSHTVTRFDELGAVSSRITYNHSYDASERIVRTDFVFDPVFNPSSINNPATISYTLIEYSEESVISSNFNYLDERQSVMTMFYQADGLIGPIVVSGEPVSLSSLPPLSSVSELLFNDRGCLSGARAGVVDEDGVLEYVGFSSEITTDDQDRPEVDTGAMRVA